MKRLRFAAAFAAVLAVLPCAVTAQQVSLRIQGMGADRAGLLPDVETDALRNPAYAARIRSASLAIGNPFGGLFERTEVVYSGVRESRLFLGRGEVETHNPVIGGLHPFERFGTGVAVAFGHYAQDFAFAGQVGGTWLAYHAGPGQVLYSSSVQSATIEARFGMLFGRNPQYDGIVRIEGASQRSEFRGFSRDYTASAGGGVLALSNILTYAIADQRIAVRLLADLSSGQAMKEDASMVRLNWHPTLRVAPAVNVTFLDDRMLGMLALNMSAGFGDSVSQGYTVITPLLSAELSPVKHLSIRAGWSPLRLTSYSSGGQFEPASYSFGVGVKTGASEFSLSYPQTTDLYYPIPRQYGTSGGALAKLWRLGWSTGTR